MAGTRRRRARPQPEDWGITQTPPPVILSADDVRPGPLRIAAKPVLSLPAGRQARRRGILGGVSFRSREIPFGSAQDMLLRFAQGGLRARSFALQGRSPPRSAQDDRSGFA